MFLEPLIIFLSNFRLFIIYLLLAERKNQRHDYLRPLHWIYKPFCIFHFFQASKFHKAKVTTAEALFFLLNI